MISCRYYLLDARGQIFPVSDAMQPNVSSHDLADQHARVMERLSKLPPFRPASLRLLAVSTDGYSAMDDFSRIFTADPAMAADLLLVANSMEFGSRSRIETIRHALSFLGLERVRSLASTIAVSAAVHQASRESVRPVWLHSIATAVIAEKLGPPRPARAIHGGAGPRPGPVGLLRGRIRSWRRSATAYPARPGRLRLPGCAGCTGDPGCPAWRLIAAHPGVRALVWR